MAQKYSFSMFLTNICQFYYVFFVSSAILLIHVCKYKRTRLVKAKKRFEILINIIPYLCRNRFLIYVNNKHSFVFLGIGMVLVVSESL